MTKKKVNPIENDTLLKKAEQNAINIAKEMSDMMSVLDAMTTWLNHFMPDYGRNDPHSNTAVAFEGLAAMKNAIYNQFAIAISNCFLFVGVGGEEAAKYSRERFTTLFGNRSIHVMQFLDKYGNVPYSWKNDDEEKFRKEIEAKVKEINRFLDNEKGLEKPPSNVEAELMELRSYKEHHEFVLEQLEDLLGKPLTTLGDLVEYIKELKNK